MFRRLVCLGSFPAYWMQANVIPITKGIPSFSVATYQPISQHQHCRRCLRAWRRFVLKDSWKAGVCVQPPSLLIGKILVPVMHFLCLSHILQVHWRVGRRLGYNRSISVQPLIGSSIMALSISSALWHWRLCVVYNDRVSIKPISARYGGWLSD